MRHEGDSSASAHAISYMCVKICVKMPNEGQGQQQPRQDCAGNKTAACLGSKAGDWLRSKADKGNTSAS